LEVLYAFQCFSSVNQYLWESFERHGKEGARAQVSAQVA